jgi:NAD(P)-dependent dehydrogenase (short-subunit alcohol dehydrogenase family)
VFTISIRYVATTREEAMRDLNGKVAVVTGGGGERSIGRATASRLAQEGARVVVADVNEAALGEAVAALRGAGHDVLGVVTDVSDLASVTALADAAWEHFGQVDIAFLNAGVGGGGSLFDDVMTDWQRVFGVNFFGVLHGIKAFAPRMIAQGTPGHILATSSGSGAVGTMYQTPSYSCSKAAVLTLMECLYAQLRDQGSAVHAHIVLPSLTRTGLAGDPEFMPMVQKGLENGGVVAVLAEPEEVAQTVLEAIQADRFWAYHDHEADKRLTGGRFAADIDWQDSVIRRKAEAMIGRAAPDPYLWGMK